MNGIKRLLSICTITRNFGRKRLKNTPYRSYYITKKEQQPPPFKIYHRNNS